VEQGRAIDIRLELYALDPAVVAGDQPAGERFAIAEGVWLRLLDTQPYGKRGGPHVLSLGLDFAAALPPAAVAEALWEFLRPRRGGRGVVTARLMRRREEQRVEQPGGAPVTGSHELWFAIPLRSSRGARRQIDAFFAEVIAEARLLPS
jgi:hypothetical protein